MSNLLAIDWDYWFPNPLDGGEVKDGSALLYDWGHRETQLMIEVLWPSRALGFVMNGLELPGMLPGWRTFLDRFTFDPNVRSYVSESNAEAGTIAPPDADEGFDSVWLYDAHHDCGYSDITVEQWREGGVYSCEDWMVMHSVRGSDLHVRYPQWKVGWDRERDPIVPVDRQVDDGEPLDVVFDAVHLCRSGAWVPSWCDDEFFEFAALLPGDVEEIGSYPLKNRGFDMKDVHELMGQREQALAMLREASDASS